MPRAIDWEETVDTSTFSAVQLQPGVVASLTWNALARWLRTYLVSFPTLIAKESMGLVVMGFHLEYRDPVSFFDCEAFRVRGAFRMMRRGERGQLDIRLFSDSHELAIAQLIVHPVAILDPVSLGAEPAPMPESLIAQFEDDETCTEAGEIKHAPGLALPVHLASTREHRRDYKKQDYRED